MSNETHTHKKLKRYRVTVPQDFIQNYRVNAANEEDAIEIVHSGEDDAPPEAEFRWSESEFVESAPTDCWLVKEEEPSDNS